jgi:hypothetical protein
MSQNTTTLILFAKLVVTPRVIAAHLILET